MVCVGERRRRHLASDVDEMRIDFTLRGQTSELSVLRARLATSGGDLGSAVAPSSTRFSLLSRSSNAEEYASLGSPSSCCYRAVVRAVVVNAGVLCVSIFVEYATSPRFVPKHSVHSDPRPAHSGSIHQRGYFGVFLMYHFLTDKYDEDRLISCGTSAVWKRTSKLGHCCCGTSTAQMVGILFSLSPPLKGWVAEWGRPMDGAIDLQLKCMCDSG
ncbi:hypothetical protein JTE90_019254 [Oedothorax gibbosus]|uniref:Uncharacterized protein n=1 Tax=Oedothorax gibbosus TaxID=931172 RepID=A0AAV6UTC8_9ARAC|nr:hypothetical protein JTE90_019254 [Oedothorax gibbosus]